MREEIGLGEAGGGRGQGQGAQWLFWTDLVVLASRGTAFLYAADTIVRRTYQSSRTPDLRGNLV
jgi:hypothetical protein